MSDSVDPGVMDCPPSIVNVRNKQNENAVVKFRRLLGVNAARSASSWNKDSSQKQKTLPWSVDQRAPVRCDMAICQSLFCLII